MNCTPDTISRDTTGTAPGRVSYGSIFWTFFRIGLFTLGGGLVMLTVMRHELVLRRRWVDEDDFLGETSVATLVPGVIAVNMAFLQGRRLRGAAGSAAAILGTVLPSFCIILLVAWVASPFFSNPRVAAFLRGCAIAVAGQLTFTSYIFARKYLRRWRNVIVCAVGLIMTAVLGLHPVWAVLTAGALGYCITDNRPDSRTG